MSTGWLGFCKLRTILPRGWFLGVSLVTSLTFFWGFAQSSPTSGTAPFILDGNRVYAELSFLRRNGSLHKALAFVDMGSPTATVGERLFKDLQIDRKKPVVFFIGDMKVQMPAADVTRDPGESRSLGTDLKVEAMLSAGILQKYQIVTDYRKRTLTFAQPGTLRGEGIGVPFHINKKTGLIAVDVCIDGKTYPMTIDNGSAYTWLRQSTAKEWLIMHPDWERGRGAVGTSNMMMSGDGAETSGILLRIPEMKIAALLLQQVGALGAGTGKGFGGNLGLFDWYSTKNAVPVSGWIGGNVLKRFRLTIDYPNGTIYWLQQADPNTHELDQVGLTLQERSGEYFIAGLATKNGKPTVDAVRVGDKLLQINGLQLRQAPWGAIYAALHGKPGDVRTLILERTGNTLSVNESVTAF